MFPLKPLTLSGAEPPYVDHRVVATTFVVEVVEDASHVTVAVVAADVVHASLVHFVSFDDSIVILLLCNTFQIQVDVLMRLSECQIVDRNVVRASEVMQYASRVTNTRVPDRRQELCNARQRRPNDAQWEPSHFGIQFVFWVFMINADLAIVSACRCSTRFLRRKVIRRLSFKLLHFSFIFVIVLAALFMHWIRKKTANLNKL